ncbi:MAG: 2-amino-4-hydroxy-6-hydroxymethyldihydropteridine diphosphokinase [Alphaproteobacteria bacterium]|nr:2-amino-4-hydroxy-6-hydroxymethyldihydropteridine diphosphokinase [Alphaproteobacteria bacterium]
MAEVYIALGSNLGDRAENLRQAESALSAVVSVRKRSTVHETAPQHVTDQPVFLNMVVAGETLLAPEALLRRLKSMEESLGRQPSRRYGPRLIDLDILYYDDQVIEQPDLVIPHPRIAERVFVLQPLLEIAPAKRHPVSGKTTAEMVSALIRKENGNNASK